jgi:hypothetical protein
MRTRVIAAACVLSFAIALGQTPHSTRLASVPDGAVSDGRYTDDALGIIFHIPPGWTTKTNPEDPVLLDPNPDGLANQCTRVFLRYENPGKDKGGFTSWGIFFAIDQRCLDAGPFPRSDKDKSKSSAVARNVINHYKNSPFFPPSGVDLFVEPANGLPIISLLGERTISVPAGAGASETTGLHLTTLFALTVSKGYWVGWASVCDDSAREELTKGSRVEIWRE